MMNAVVVHDASGKQCKAEHREEHERLCGVLALKYLSKICAVTAEGSMRQSSSTLDQMLELLRLIWVACLKCRDVGYMELQPPLSYERLTRLAAVCEKVRGAWKKSFRICRSVAATIHEYWAVHEG